MANQNKKLPQWLEKVKYLTLSRAAEIMGYPVDVLLHLGVLGELEIRAPVLMPSEYEWSVPFSGLRDPSSGLGDLWVEVFPTSTTFDYRDRVVLFANDLAKIEAAGSLALRRFYSPEVMAELTDSLRVKFSKRPDLGMTRPGEDVIQAVIAGGVTTPWFAVEPDDSDRLFPGGETNPPQEALVMLHHLWVSVTEFRRFFEGKPQDEVVKVRASVETKSDAGRRKNPKVAERHATNREQVLFAALSCIHKAPSGMLPKTAVGLAELVDEKGALFWKSGAPPLARDTITRLLSETMDFPDSPMWEGQKEST